MLVIVTALVNFYNLLFFIGMFNVQKIQSKTEIKTGGSHSVSCPYVFSETVISGAISVGAIYRSSIHQDNVLRLMLPYSPCRLR